MPYDGEINWEWAIRETEDSLSSMAYRHYNKGNIAFDIPLMIQKAHEFESRYAKYRDITTVLKAFVLQHYLYGRPLLLNKEEAPLVEASVGRIHHFGQEPATILDEPFALRAAVNYFRRSDPEFHRSMCAVFSGSPKYSVVRSSWEMAVLPSLVEVFHDKVLSDTTLVPSEAVRNDGGLMYKKASIVGLDPLMLGTVRRSMSLDEILEGTSQEWLTQR